MAFHQLLNTLGLFFVVVSVKIGFYACVPSFAIRTDTNEYVPAKIYHVLVQISPGYSHCLETFGIASTLVGSGGFQATVFVPELCEALGVRMLEMSQYPERLHLIRSEMSAESIRELMEIRSQFTQSAVLSNASFSMPKHETFVKMLNVGDEFFRRDNFSVGRQIHQQNPFHVAICDGFSLACFEFADQQQIVGIWAAVQGPPRKRDVGHNGLWLAACPRKAQCSLSERVASFYDNFVPFHLPFARQRIKHDVSDMVHNIAAEARRGRLDMPPIRKQYPLIDQQVLGTNKPAGYYRTDHVVIGPTWLNLQQQELNASHPLTAWLERAAQPVVFVSFGTVTEFNNTELSIILEGIVSRRWQTIWKTNSKMVQEILECRTLTTSARNNVSSETRALACDENVLQVVDWAPQYALLRHPKLRTFVTHGGMSSLMEAFANGVPLICVPIFGDQPYNCEQTAAAGTGIVIPKTEVTPEKLSNTIERVLFNGQSLATRAAKVAQYHATLDTARRLVEFVSHYAQFKYEFSEIADDHFDWVMYWNLDLWSLAAATVTALATVITALTYKFANITGAQLRDGSSNAKSARKLTHNQLRKSSKDSVGEVCSSDVLSFFANDAPDGGESVLRRRREQ